MKIKYDKRKLTRAANLYPEKERNSSKKREGVKKVDYKLVIGQDHYWEFVKK